MKLEKQTENIEENIIKIIDELRSENKNNKINKISELKIDKEALKIQKNSFKLEKLQNSNTINSINELNKNILKSNDKKLLSDNITKLNKNILKLNDKKSSVKKPQNKNLKPIIKNDNIINKNKKINQSFIDYIEKENKNKENQNKIQNDKINKENKKFNKNQIQLQDSFLKIWNSESVGYLKDMTSALKSSVGSQIKDVLGPIDELVDVSKQMISSTFKFVKSIGTDISSVFGIDKEKEPKSDKKRNNLLTKISETLKSISKSFKEETTIMKLRNKAAARKITEKKPEGIWKLLIAAGALLTGIIYGYAKKLTLAFKFILSPLKSIGKLFKEDGALGFIGKSFKNIFGKEGKLAFIFKEDGALSFIGKSFKNIFGKEGKIFKLFEPLINIGETPLGKFIGKWFTKGKIFGEVLLPIQMIYNGIKGLFSAKGIRDKILAASAGILNPILQIPEMIGNAGLWIIRKMFGKDIFKGFKFDFNTDKIIKVVNDLTDWLKINVTNKIFDFFNKTLPDLFKSITKWFDNMIGKIKFYMNPLNWGKNYDKELEKQKQINRFDKKTGRLLKNEGESNKEYFNRIMKWKKSLIPEHKKQDNIINLENKKVDIAKNAYNKKQQQIKEQNKKSDMLLKSNKEIAQQNQNTIQTIITSNFVNQKQSDPKEIPEHHESALLSLVSNGALL